MDNNILIKQQMIQGFINKVKIESGYTKFLEIDFINKMIMTFNKDYLKQDYPKGIDKCLEMALQFYKDFNYNYYKIIVKGITDKKIIIDSKLFKPHVDIKNNIAYIRLYGNDGDLFLLVHEFAHYIDRNSEPKIVADDVSFLSEIFSFYMEKQLELWLSKEKYDNLILTRRNNRMYFESEMVNAVEYELYCEQLFREKGEIDEKDVSIEKVKLIMKYDVPNTVNYLMRYPLANMLSDYLIDIGYDLESENLSQKCLQIDLYQVLEKWTKKLLCRSK